MLLKRKAFALMIGFLCCLSTLGFSQDQRVADSLVLIYQKNELTSVDKLALLNELAFNENKDPRLALKYAEELIDLATKLGNNEYLNRGHLQKGNINFQSGNFKIALDEFFTAAEVAINADFPAGEGTAYMSVADVYSRTGDKNNAESYYKKAISILRKADNQVSLAAALLNAGDEFFINKKYQVALQYFEESGQIFKEQNYPVGIAYNQGNIGKVYYKQGKYELAKTNLAKAIATLKELQDDYGISDYAIYLSDVFEKQNDLPAAFTFAKTSLELSKKNDLKEQVSAANLQLSELYDLQGNKDLALKHYKTHVALKDSINSIVKVQEMANLRTNFEVSQKQTEITLLNQQKSNQNIVTIATAIALFLIGLLAIGLFRRYRFIRRTNEIIEKEKNRSDSLLLNILPEETAQELKENGKVRAKKFESITILFTDFIGFTQYAENLSPEKLVESIDFYFSKFDEIIEKYGLEKIKTLGDSYMCTGGLHSNREDHAIKMVFAAIEIAGFVEEVKQSKMADLSHFNIRIGINTGPVVAGVVGTKKFAYDIWGDSVNVASRMESTSESGKINISENTYQLIKNDFNCVYRGEIKVKNRGLMKMYFVNN